jgi:hypothetical protein
MSQQEQVFFDDGNVRVSNMSLLVRARGASYPIDHLSEVTLGEMTTKSPWRGMQVLLGVVFVIAGGLSLLFVMNSPVVALIFAALLLSPGVALLWSAGRGARPAYAVSLKASSGPVPPISGPHRAYVEGVVRAIWQAQEQSRRDKQVSITNIVSPTFNNHNNPVFSQNNSQFSVNDAFKDAHNNAVGPGAQSASPTGQNQPGSFGQPGYPPGQGYSPGWYPPELGPWRQV